MNLARSLSSQIAQCQKLVNAGNPRVMTRQTRGVSFLKRRPIFVRQRIDPDTEPAEASLGHAIDGFFLEPDYLRPEYDGFGAGWPPLRIGRPSRSRPSRASTGWSTPSRPASPSGSLNV